MVVLAVWKLLLIKDLRKKTPDKEVRDPQFSRWEILVRITNSQE
jgi:hypothetical protein